MQTKSLARHTIMVVIMYVRHRQGSVSLRTALIACCVVTAGLETVCVGAVHVNFEEKRAEKHIEIYEDGYL